MRRSLLVPVLALVLAPAGVAATFSFSVTSPTTVTAPAVTLSGDDQTKTFTTVSQVAYSGNPNAGWKIQASATAPTSGTRMLPAIAVTAGSFACVSACKANPSPTVTLPVTLSTTAATIFNAAAGSGDGTYNVTSTYQLTYPASALPGIYTSTVTLTGSTGP